MWTSKYLHVYLSSLVPSSYPRIYLPLPPYTRKQRFKKGDEILYIRGSDPPLDGVVQKVHLEDETPYYTVLINVTGREKNTDSAHLRHKGALVS